MFNDYVRALESDCCAAPAFRQHCRMLRTVNGTLDRLARRRATCAADYVTLALALLDMRACLAEKALGVVQQHVASLARAVHDVGACVAPARDSGGAAVVRDGQDVGACVAPPRGAAVRAARPAGLQSSVIVGRVRPASARR